MPTTMKFAARSAGKNWIFAIQPKYVLARPVKSKKINKMAIKNIEANDIRIFLNIKYILHFY